MKLRLEALTDPQGRPLNSLVFKPEQIYRHVRNVAPDLIVHFGGLYWRSIGSMGHGRFHVEENDTGPDACNHAQFGAFILYAPRLEPRGHRRGLLSQAPVLTLPPRPCSRPLIVYAHPRRTDDKNVAWLAVLSHRER